MGQNSDDINKLIGVHNCFCVGRNFRDHAKELNNPIPTEPLIFLKPISSLSMAQNGRNQILLPDSIGRVDYEVEWVLQVDRYLDGPILGDWKDAIRCMGVGIDVTARDLQSVAKKSGQPWTFAKGYKSFGQVSQLVPLEVTDWEELEVTLTLNREVKQKAKLEEMIFSPSAVLNYISERVPLLPGDLIFMGTPEGVGALKQGDFLSVSLGDLVSMEVDVISK